MVQTDSSSSERRRRSKSQNATQTKLSATTKFIFKGRGDLNEEWVQTAPNGNWVSERQAVSAHSNRAARENSSSTDNCQSILGKTLPTLALGFAWYHFNIVHFLKCKLVWIKMSDKWINVNGTVNVNHENQSESKWNNVVVCHQSQSLCHTV